MDWTIGPLDRWTIFWTICWTIFWNNFFWTNFWTILSGGGRFIYNSGDFIVSAYVKLGASEIYKIATMSINSKDGNHLYFLLQIS